MKCEGYIWYGFGWIGKSKMKFFNYKTVQIKNKQRGVWTRSWLINDLYILQLGCNAGIVDAGAMHIR